MGEQLPRRFGSCGLRRSEVVALSSDDIQKRENSWAIVDLVGKAGHVRTVLVPGWVKDAVDDWEGGSEWRVRIDDRAPHVRGGTVVEAQALFWLFEVTADDISEFLGIDDVVGIE